MPYGKLSTKAISQKRKRDYGGVGGETVDEDYNFAPGSSLLGVLLQSNNHFLEFESGAPQKILPRPKDQSRQRRPYTADIHPSRWEPSRWETQRRTSRNPFAGTPRKLSDPPLPIPAPRQPPREVTDFLDRLERKGRKRYDMDRSGPDLSGADSPGPDSSDDDDNADELKPPKHVMLPGPPVMRPMAAASPSPFQKKKPSSSPSIPQGFREVEQGDTVVLVRDDPIPPPGLLTIPRAIIPPAKGLPPADGLPPAYGMPPADGLPPATKRHMPVVAMASAPIHRYHLEPVRPPPPPVRMKSNVRPAAAVNRPPHRAAAVKVVTPSVTLREAPEAPKTIVQRAPPPRPMPASAPVLQLGTLAPTTRHPIDGLLPTYGMPPAVLPPKSPDVQPPAYGMPPADGLPPGVQLPPQQKKKVKRTPMRGAEIMRNLMDQIRRAPTPEARFGIIDNFAQRDFEQLDPRAQEEILKLRRRMAEQGLTPARVEAHEHRVTHDDRRLANLEDEVRAREEAVQRTEDRVTHLRAKNEQDEVDLINQRNFADRLDTDLSTGEERLRELEQTAGDINRARAGLDLEGVNAEKMRSESALLSVLSRRNALLKQITDLKMKAPPKQYIEALRTEVENERRKISDAERDTVGARERVGEVTATAGNRALELGEVRKRGNDLRMELEKREYESRKAADIARRQLLNQRQQLKQNEQLISSLSGRKQDLQQRIAALEKTDRLSGELSKVRDELGTVNRGLETLPKIERVRAEQHKIDVELLLDRIFRDRDPPDPPDLVEELRNLDQEIRDEDEIERTLDAAPNYDTEIAGRDRDLAEESRLRKELEVLEKSLEDARKDESSIKTAEINDVNRFKRRLSRIQKELNESLRRTDSPDTDEVLAAHDRMIKDPIYDRDLRRNLSKRRKLIANLRDEVQEEISRNTVLSNESIASAEERLRNLRLELDEAQRDTYSDRKHESETSRRF